MSIDQFGDGGANIPNSVSSLDDRLDLLIEELNSKKCFSHVSKYELICHIGRGNNDSVYKAKKTETGVIYAVKDVFQKRKEVFSENTYREISCMMNLKHENIVAFEEFLFGDCYLRSIYIVMEYCKKDLIDFIDIATLQQTEIKCLMLMLMKGLDYLHEGNIIHRDINPANLLINSSGILKIADFGSARFIDEPGDDMTPNVGTGWYKAPEMLFSLNSYTTAVDMWSAGCIFGELLLCKPLFPGQSDIEEISLHIKLLGTPDDVLLPGLSSSPIMQDYVLAEQKYNTFAQVFQKVSHSAYILLEHLLTYNFLRRMTAKNCLLDRYFSEEPLPCDPSALTLRLNENYI